MILLVCRFHQDPESNGPPASMLHVLHKLFGAYRGTAVSISKCIRPVLECYPVTAKLLNTRSISDIRDKIRGFAKKY